MNRFKREDLAKKIATMLNNFNKGIYTLADQFGIKIEPLDQNPFYVGFISNSCFDLAQILSRGTIKKQDAIDVVRRVSDKIFEDKSKNIESKTEHYVQSGNSNFFRGRDASYNMWWIFFGLIDLDSDAFYQYLKEKSKDIHEYSKYLDLHETKSENEAVVQYLNMRTYHDILGYEKWNEML